jgi:hypothetical protein
MSRKTYRIKLQLDGDKKPQIYRTDGVPTHCCSFQTDYFCWEKNTKFNQYNGWNGYISEQLLKSSLKNYNPDFLIL